MYQLGVSQERILIYNGNEDVVAKICPTENGIQISSEEFPDVNLAVEFDEQKMTPPLALINLKFS